MKGDIYAMESKMNEFIKITEGEKVALIDPVGKVCLGVSKRFADNLDKTEFQEKLFPVWKQQTEFIKEMENNHEKINTVYLMVTRKCNMNCDFCAISANDKLRPEKEFKLEDIQNKVVPFFQKNKPHKMILTGGEPLIKEQIVEIAKALRNGLTCPITLQSNGLAITRELIEQLKGYINEIDFSTMHMFGTPEKEQQLKVKEETIAYSTSIEDLFEKEGHFYVYFNRKECPYCDNIEDDIKQFKKENAVYEIDAEACKGTRNYDWDSHEKKYDVEIGEKDSTGKIVFYDGLDENLIKEKYPPIHYKIIWANENYAALHEGKEAGKVYAISTHPNIKKEELSEKKFVLGGVPTLVEFENHKVINFYFDDKEIIDFLESDTQPLDKYWNLE